MGKTLYSIVDIETTGCISSENKITEIAALKFDGEKVLETFHSLVNPERRVPPNVTYLTGISNEMLSKAPKFYQIAKEFYLFLEDSIFVAHNVYFDFNFIKKEFRDLGFDFRSPKMCTVKMARKYIPGHRSYSLGKISSDLNISLKDRHRAMGDAKATLELFKLIQSSAASLDHLVSPPHEQLRPPHVAPEQIEKLPHRPGVYMFFGQSGELLYIGKSKDLKKRVLSHFRLNVDRRKDLEMKAQIYKIRFKVTGHELSALLLENFLIKKHRPRFNSALRGNRFTYALCREKDGDGFYDLKIKYIRNPKDEIPLMHFFSSKRNAQNYRERLYRDLFPPCESGPLLSGNLRFLKDKTGRERFNQLIDEKLQDLDYPEHSFKLCLEGRKQNEKLYLVFEKQRLRQLHYKRGRKTVWKKNIIEDQDSRKIILNYIRQKQDYKVLAH